MEPDKLEALVLAIDESVEVQGWNQGHLLIGVADKGPVGVVIATVAFNTHPLNVLDGMKAPDDWLAIGVCCEGWAAPMDSGARPSQSKGRMRVRNTVLVSRDSTVAAVMRFAGDEPKLMPEGEGAVLDALKDAIGLAHEEVRYG